MGALENKYEMSRACEMEEGVAREPVSPKIVPDNSPKAKSDHCCLCLGRAFLLWVLQVSKKKEKKERKRVEYQRLNVLATECCGTRVKVF